MSMLSVAAKKTEDECAVSRSFPSIKYHPVSENVPRLAFSRNKHRIQTVCSADAKGKRGGAGAAVNDESSRQCAV